MEGFLEEVVFDLSLMDEPDVLRCKKRKGTLPCRQRTQRVKALRVKPLQKEV